jgi:hypothetical protein
MQLATKKRQKRMLQSAPQARAQEILPDSLVWPSFCSSKDLVAVYLKELKALKGNKRFFVKLS